jgi:hypothetical protein
VRIELLIAAVVSVLASGCHDQSPSAPTSAGERVPAAGAGGIWVPAMNTPWQWQLTGALDLTIDVPMYDIDLFDNSAATVAGLHARGRHVVCYFNAGAWENWRTDALQFPSSVLGNGTRWRGERWLDIRQRDIVWPLMEARMDLCKQKGFDAVEPDNIDGYTNSTGFPLTASDQATYNMWLSNAAHARGLSIGLKNDLDQVSQLVSAFDWALAEQCFQYQECSRLAPFTQSGKAVFEVEYNLPLSAFCSQAIALKFNAMRKSLDLDAFREPCVPTSR